VKSAPPYPPSVSPPASDRPAEGRLAARVSTPPAVRVTPHATARRQALSDLAALGVAGLGGAGLLAHRTVAAQGALDSETDVPYVITPQTVVDAMLELAGVGPNDRLVDLGSGDGRIVITAARRWGTTGLGVDLDPTLVALARRRAVEAGVADRVRFEAQDLFDTDLSQASVITLYLLPAVNLMLRPRLQALRPGTRIVSHDWDMGDWPARKTLEVAAPGKPVGLRQVSRLMLWTVGHP
jgi:SAM-dependent methyltransferase